MDGSGQKFRHAGGCGPKALEEVRQELRSVMEDWLLLGFQLGDRIPVVDRINLNPRGRVARQATQGRRKANVRSASIRRSPTHA
jgi:hypothetical protein